MRQRYQVLFVVLLAFGLRLVHLQARALWYDEAFAVFYAGLSPARMVYGTVTPVQGAGAADVHPLLYYFLLHGWMAWVGRSPLAVRFLSVGLGMLTVALLWRLAAWCFGRRTGLVVGLLAAINPFHVAYSQEARMYALLGLAAVAAAWGLLRALEERSGIRDLSFAHLSFAHSRWWLLYTAAAALTLYAHNLGASVLLALHVLAVTRRRWWPRLPALVLADLGVLALFSPWLVGVLPGQVGFVGRGYWLSSPRVEEVVRAVMFPVLTFYEPSPMGLLGLGLFLSIAMLVLLAIRAWQVPSRAGWFLVLCWVPVLLLLLVSRWRPVYLARALLPSALFYVVAVGWLLVRGGLPCPIHLGLVVLLVVATAGSLGNHYAYARFPRPPFDRLNALLRTRIAPGEVVVHDSKLTFFPAHYYDPSLRQVFCPDLPGTGADTLALPTQEALGLFAAPISQAVKTNVTGVWFVVFEQAFQEYQALGFRDPPNMVWLHARCRAREGPFLFSDLLVYRFTRCADHK